MTARDRGAMRPKRKLLVGSCWLLAAGGWGLEDGNWSSVAGNWSLVAGGWSFVACGSSVGGFSGVVVRVGAGVWLESG